VATDSKLMQVALTIAGSDSGGGAGIQADLKTFEAHGVFGTSVITALTAQNTLGVRGVLYPDATFVLAQLDAVLDDFDVAAIKVGMAGTADTIRVLSQRLASIAIPLIIDPVMIATSGAKLLEADALTALKESLLPLATLITPNVPEAEELTGLPIRTQAEAQTAVEALAKRYPNLAILLKGGHLPFHPSESRDTTLVRDWLAVSGVITMLEYPYIPTLNTHGTGCTLSAAIAANMALGMVLPSAVQAAREYLQRAITHAPEDIGHGSGPLRHNLHGY
jgi:hydroxymethylpyrimidine/phosphomethylpyrimidine kinase